ncbi:DUF5359 family protein [Ectobacillus antri]|jgi:hypothetical protein|uniref:DUF5359 family protein n=1 Tax=Ectobacillus antri TaxID=2486280 RepID=A0ABT6H1W5_9BACI|nr:DUF5359 family protein [Ectobacillus antri]MDG4656078.1 DUF5359 family protein [Ectobacillus antri]MDG5752753.1 DUF5359 family protein [Ectobacillus antri]
MEQIERMLIKLVAAQFILLVLSQSLLTYEPIARYTNKLVLYEGVWKEVTEQVIQYSFALPIVNI